MTPTHATDRVARASGAATRLAVLIPCLDEEATIGGVVAQFRAAVPDAEIHVFDNASHDATRSRALAAGAHVTCEPRRGKGHVLQAMFRTVDADAYLLVDGDGTYPASEARALLAPVLADEADMVVGSRLHPAARSDFSLSHRAGNHLFVLVLRILFGMSTTDLLSGYRALSRAVVRDLHLTSEGFEVDSELTIRALRARFRVAEHPVRLERRPPGSRSKLRPVRDGLAILRTMLALRREATHDTRQGA